MSDSTHITGRSLSLDAHRGLIMVLMAIDHASYFIARVHSREMWGTPLPVYPDAVWFWTRWITHLCAPGFFFLMGMGMTLFADARRRAGWEEDRITRSFVIRGLLLILFQLIIENPAWIVSSLSVHAGAALIRGGPMPGGGTEGMVYLGVLFCLGSVMVFWAFIRKASSWLVTVTSLGAILLTQYIIPGPNCTETVHSPLITALVIPGHSNMLVVLYPVIPWLGVTGLGLLYGRLLRGPADKAARVALWAGIGSLTLFVVIRATGGFGNLNVVPAGWMGFLNVVKYPPSLAFLSCHPRDQSSLDGLLGLDGTAPSQPPSSPGDIRADSPVLLSPPPMGIWISWASLRGRVRSCDHVCFLVTWFGDPLPTLLLVRPLQSPAARGLSLAILLIVVQAGISDGVSLYLIRGHNPNQGMTQDASMRSSFQ